MDVFSDLGYGSKSGLGHHEDMPGVMKVPAHHPGLQDYSPAPWLYRPFTVLPGYLPLPSPLLINRFAGIHYSMHCIVPYITMEERSRQKKR